MRAITAWEDLQELIDRGATEGQQLEFKRDVPDNDKIAKAICAFANASGGVIIFGADYDDKKTLALRGFEGVPLLPNFDGRLEQIAMEVTPSVVVEPSKPISIPGKDGKFVYTVLVHPGQRQPHRSPDGRFMIRCGSQSGPLPENIIEQMYLARESYGQKADAIIEKANYGLPADESLYPSNEYWIGMAIMPIHFRNGFVPNSPGFREILNEQLSVDVRMSNEWRETYFGYRFIAPRQEVLGLMPKQYSRRIEVHNNGLIVISDLDDYRGANKAEGDCISGNHVRIICETAFNLARKVYAHANYGGFLRCYLSLKSANKKFLVFYQERTSMEKSPYPFEDQTELLRIWLDCSVLDFESALKDIMAKLRQSFGFPAK